MDAKFKATLPKDEESNGLAGSDWNRELLTDVESEHVAIVTFKTQDMNGLPVTDEAEAEVLRQKLAAFQAQRLGLVQLPINDTVPVALDVEAENPFSDGGDAA
jgi:hypothetical protein